MGFVKRYMTVPEVAKYFSVSRSTVYEWVQTGRVIAWHPEGRVSTRGIRVSVESVTRLEQSGILNPQDYSA